MTITNETDPIRIHSDTVPSTTGTHGSTVSHLPASRAIAPDARQRGLGSRIRDFLLRQAGKLCGGGHRTPPAAGGTIPLETIRHARQPAPDPVRWFPRPLLQVADSFAGLRALPQTVGAGGMATVRRFAVTQDVPLVGKVITRTTDDTIAEKMLIHEMAGFDTVYRNAGPSPNLVDVYGLTKVALQPGRAAQSLVLLMEEVPGPDGCELGDALRTLLDTGAIEPIEYDGAIRFVMQNLLQGVLHMERAGVLHCDLKPDNFILDERTLAPKIFDLGFWLSPGQNRLRGTRGYCAPETLQSLPMSGKSDIYSLGVTLLRLIRGAEQGITREFRRNVETEARKSADPCLNLLARMLWDGRLHYKMAPVQSPQQLFGKELQQEMKKRRALSRQIQEHRITAADALQHPYITGRLLDDDQAKDVLRRACELARAAKPQTDTGGVRERSSNRSPPMST